MQLWEAKDIVRAHFGGTAFPTVMLDHALTQGRRTIEAHANFWWMQGETDFALSIDRQTYPLESGPILLPDYKDINALSWREPLFPQGTPPVTGPGKSWEPVWVGDMPKEELDVLYDTDDSGSPDIAIIENNTMYVYPPLPNKAYLMRMYRYVWTNNPAQTEEDDLLKYFPMALIYSALSWGYEMQLKDMQGAAYWKGLLGGQPFGRGGELAKLKKENFKRGWRNNLMLVPRGGPGIGSLRRISNLQIYGNRVV